MITTAALGRERAPRRVRLDVALSRSLASVALWLMFALIVALIYAMLVMALDLRRHGLRTVVERPRIIFTLYFAIASS